MMEIVGNSFCSHRPYHNYFISVLIKFYVIFFLQETTKTIINNDIKKPSRHVMNQLFRLVLEYHWPEVVLVLQQHMVSINKLQWTPSPKIISQQLLSSCYHWIFGWRFNSHLNKRFVRRNTSEIWFNISTENRMKFSCWDHHHSFELKYHPEIRS